MNTRKRAKYASIKTNGFDSKKESKRIAELRLLEKAGKIYNFAIQPRFLLQESFKVGNVTFRKIEYVADASYMESDKYIVEDVKGFKTEVYKIKKKLLLKRYPDIIFRET